MMEKISLLLKGKWYLALLAAILCAVCLLPAEGSMTQEERRISQALSQVAGAGRVQVTVYYNQSSSAFGGNEKCCVGAVAVCEGAGDIAVRMNIARALETLLGLEARDVVVLEMEEGR